jgi:hypothetical protein
MSFCHSSSNLREEDFGVNRFGFNGLRKSGDRRDDSPASAIDLAAVIDGEDLDVVEQGLGDVFLRSVGAEG